MKDAGSHHVIAYRPDIDGLRAIAVTVVVLFHLGSTVIRGGFIGVDVFFVISGFLITQIVMKEVAADDFTILGFYDRRIRRIFPALFLVIAASAAAAIALFLPLELIDFAHSGIAAVFFVSNMYFLATTDYFNLAAERAPLLHTWSLAVEEQFYIVFPLLLVLLGSVKRWTRAMVLAGIALASFVFSLWLVRTHQAAAFYIAPARAWELLAGVLLGLNILPRLTSRLLREILAAGGLALIALACVYYYRNMVFPGFYAAPPVLGAVAIIYAGQCGPTLVGRLLSTRAFVFTGLVSYSLYLWHWPLIVFTQLYNVVPLTNVQAAGVFAASYLLAVLTWRFVETPFRRRQIFASLPLLRAAAVASMAVFLFGGLGLTASGGLAGTLPADIARTAAYVHYEDRSVYRRGTCFLDSHVDKPADFDDGACLKTDPARRNILILGDSHAAHLWIGMSREFPDINFLQANASGCKPVLNPKGARTCVTLMDRILGEVLKTTPLDGIIISARWDEEDIPAVVATVDAVAKQVPRVYVAGPIVEYEQSLPRLLARAQMNNEPSLVVQALKPGRADIDLRLQQALKGTSAVYLSSYAALCPRAEECVTRSPEAVPVQWDYGHLTAEGSAYLASRFKQMKLLQ